MFQIAIILKKGLPLIACFALFCCTPFVQAQSGTDTTTQNPNQDTINEYNSIRENVVGETNPNQDTIDQYNALRENVVGDTRTQDNIDSWCPTGKVCTCDSAGCQVSESFDGTSQDYYTKTQDNIDQWCPEGKVCTCDDGGCRASDPFGGSSSGASQDDFSDVQSGSSGGSGGTGISGSGVTSIGRLTNLITSTTLDQFILKIIDVLLVFAVPLIVIYIMYAGYLFVTAAGAAEQISQARTALLYAVVGGVIILGAKLIITVIQGTISAF